MRKAPVDGSFTIEVDFYAANVSQAADGFAIAIQGEGPAALGADGGSVGLNSGTSPAIQNAIGVLFSINWRDNSGVIHISARDMIVSTHSLTMPLGQWHKFRVIYDHATQLFSIEQNGVTIHQGLSFGLSVPDAVGGTQAWVGVTAGTGSSCTEERIRSFDYTVQSSGSSGALSHTVTLHPGEHGSIAGMAPGSNYVTTVTNGAVFPPVTIVTNAGWSFTGWNPAAPATDKRLPSTRSKRVCRYQGWACRGRSLPSACK